MKKILSNRFLFYLINIGFFLPIVVFGIKKAMVAFRVDPFENLIDQKDFKGFALKPMELMVDAFVYLNTEEKFLQLSPRGNLPKMELIGKIDKGTKLSIYQIAHYSFQNLGLVYIAFAKFPDLPEYEFEKMEIRRFLIQDYNDPTSSLMINPALLKIVKESIPS